MSVITIFAASYDDQDAALSTHSEPSADELSLPEASSHDERCSSHSVSASSAPTSTNSSSSSDDASSDLPASSSFSLPSTATSLPRPASPCPLPVAPPRESVLDLLSSFLSNPPIAPRRTRFLALTSPTCLRTLFAAQLAVHALFLAAAAYVLGRRAELAAVLPAGEAQSGAFRMMMQLPAWLLVRSVVSIGLSVRRAWLAGRWRSSGWEAAWCLVVMWLSTLVFGGAGMVALGQLDATANPMYMAMWVLDAALLLLVGAHMCVYVLFLLIFPLSALTVNMPMVPLDASYYFDLPGSPRPKRSQGLTQQQLDQLPTTTCTAQAADPVCAVCMDDVAVGDVQRVLRCGHGYHQPCIDPWLLKRKVCPLCVRAVRVAGRPSVSEWVVEMAEKRRQSSQSR